MTVYTGRTFQTCALRVWGIWVSMRDFHLATVRSDEARENQAALAHPAFIARELHQRNKRERQLKAQNDLAEDEQAHGFQARVPPARLAAGLADDAPVEITACIRRSAIA